MRVDVWRKFEKAGFCVVEKADALFTTRESTAALEILILCYYCVLLLARLLLALIYRYRCGWSQFRYFGAVV